MEVVQLLGSQGFWQHQVLREVGSYSSRKYSDLEGYGNQYWPICSSILAWRTTFPFAEDMRGGVGAQMETTPAAGGVPGSVEEMQEETLSRPV